MAAAASSVRVTGAITGLPGGTDSFDLGALTNADCPKARTTQRINATFAAVTFPALDGSAVIKGVIIVPLNGSGTITLKGVTGDTGMPIHATEPTGPIRLANVTASNFGITTTADVTFQFIWL
jgi:hypothetical protein